MNHYFPFFTDVNYSWLSVPFSNGDFKSVTVMQPSSSRARMALLQVLCESLELQVPSPQVRREAPYVALLQKLVSSCSCTAIII